MATVRSGIELKDLGINNSIKNITNKNQKQVITKSNIPELIELIISSNKEYFNLKDNSIYLTNIIQIYKYKTKLLLDDVTGTILHLRNVFKSQNNLTSITTSSDLTGNSINISNNQNLNIHSKDDVTSKRIISDINNIISLNNGDINKYLSTKTTLKSQQKKNNLIQDALDATSLFQYGDLDDLALDDDIEVGRGKKDKRTSLLNYERYDNNTQSSSNASMSLDDVEFGRNESFLNKADVSGISSLNDDLAINEPQQDEDPFGFHQDMDQDDDILNNQGDDELDDGDFSLEQPRIMSEPENIVEFDDMDLNINTPPDSPVSKQSRKKVQFGIPNNRFIKNYNLQVVTPDRAVEVPKRVYLQALKRPFNVQNEDNSSGRVNKRLLEQIYNYNDIQTMSLIDLRQLKKTKTSNVNTSIVQSDDENAGDLSLQFDNLEEPEDFGNDTNDFNLMDHGSINESLDLGDNQTEKTSNTQSSYLTSATPSMRIQREKDHIQQEMILAKTTSEKKDFVDIFDAKGLSKSEVSQLFLQVLNLTTEDKILVEQVGANIYISK
ncbi:hypothetical protein D499_0C00320 [Hanseniaspora uvarum DSM 2768]|nr:hypothetical protein FOG48_01038 [Hanseniaspora uvarum]KKA03150.1 hypothetical protein D499_0C00320 [Hanseniaspora uvarum DSM 2768]GMM41125.1 hypothetical protein DAHU10_020260 [Hanseniaspora uvarum]